MALDLSPVVGFLAFEYNENPLLGISKLTVANLTESITVICGMNWYDELSLHVEKLKITELYTDGNFQYKHARQFVPIGVQCKPIYSSVTKPCELCKKFSCSAAKISKCIECKCNLKMKIQCDV
ncbi:hypothetical protein TNCT_688831 [Trichonephila clavata]|uniref:Uncharacterized protein n=1 Tax=Trichonephila clavata TaxID=2740835 RepID=A0A8X6H4D7_TRICU|nr:hypothetical protein TNCT_688831 [Trichonephila clavata]